MGGSGCGGSGRDASEGWDRIERTRSSRYSHDSRESGPFSDVASFIFMLALGGGLSGWMIWNIMESGILFLYQCFNYLYIRFGARWPVYYTGRSNGALAG